MSILQGCIDCQGGLTHICVYAIYENMTHVQQMVLAIEAELKGKGIPVCDLTTEAGIVPSTWTRWKSGSNSPTLKAWNETLEAKARLIRRGKK
jgi:hypothetical protein